MSATPGLQTLFVVSAVAALAPLIRALLPGPRVPQVVLLLLGGVIVGPQLLDLAKVADITLLADVGLGFLFLLAGYELDLDLLRERAGKLAVLSWTCTAVIALTVVGVLAALGLVHAFIPVALALTTTALGTLLPILRDNSMLTGRFGRYVLAAGAIGELFPILGIALFLGAKNKWVALGSLVAMSAVAGLLTLVPRALRGTRIARHLLEGEHTTAQSTLRWSLVLLLLLLVVADQFGLDAVLGAVLAGVVLRRWSPGDVRSLEEKLDAVGYGVFIPLFFVFSGMSLDIRSIGHSPARLIGFLVLLLVVRGLPTLAVYRWALPRGERTELMLLSSTALPVLVALTEIGLRDGTMLPENAAALVGAGGLGADLSHARRGAVPATAGLSPDAGEDRPWCLGGVALSDHRLRFSP